MNSENIEESISFLEEALNSNIFEFKNKDIKCKNILKYLSKQNKKILNIEQSDDEKSDDDSSDESTYEPSEIVEVTPIKFPSELYEVNSDESNNSIKSKYNLAYTNKNSDISGSENIINIKS
jgi:hypothetical protein